MNESTEQLLQRIRAEIEYHRKKAEDYRRRADMQDRFADERVKIAAELGTGELPLLKTHAPT